MKYSNSYIFGIACLSTATFDIHHSTFIILFYVFSVTHDGMVEPFQVTPPQSAVYSDANYGRFPLQCLNGN
jgi:hypothetical protein